MECIEARALKSSLLSEMIGMQSTQQASFEEFWCFSSDEFSVDDLLDLSDKDFSNSGDGSFEESSEEFSNSGVSNSTISCNFSSAGDLVSIPAGQLPVPIDDMESLEWLSQIVDDSLSELSLFCPVASLKEDAGGFAVKRFEPVVKLEVQSFTVLGLPYPVPRKCRSERSRKAGRVWSTGPSSLTESSSATSSSHESSVTSPNFVELPPAKKQKKDPVSENGQGSIESLPQRRCTHCLVQKTPQWRTGPLGPKTLCNACGVRFKSGRLYPEYRPARSPTFSGDVHSNSHRKVLEMRKKKESEVSEPGLGLSMAVQSY